jgi:hypothetical protein
MNYSSLHPLAIDNVRSQIERIWDLSLGFVTKKPPAGIDQPEGGY